MILNVKNLSHGFGDRAIFENVSFRLLKGEHIGLIGANGEGKSYWNSVRAQVLSAATGIPADKIENFAVCAAALPSTSTWIQP